MWHEPQPASGGVRSDGGKSVGGSPSCRSGDAPGSNDGAAINSSNSTGTGCKAPFHGKGPQYDLRVHSSSKGAVHARELKHVP